MYLPIVGEYSILGWRWKYNLWQSYLDRRCDCGLHPMWPDWAFFENYWEQGSLQKKPKCLATILGYSEKWHLTDLDTFWATFYCNIWSHVTTPPQRTLTLWLLSANHICVTLSSSKHSLPHIHHFQEDLRKKFYAKKLCSKECFYLNTGVHVARPRLFRR